MNNLGILDVYRKSLEQKEETIKKMPPGDERAVRDGIAKRVRGLMAAADHIISQGRKADRTIDEIELYLEKI